MIWKRGRLMKDDRGGVAVEFVALLPAFLFLTFFVFDVAIAVLWVGTVEKAAQLGARLAIVSDFAVTGLAPTDKNGVAMNSAPGQNCPAGCVAFNSGNPVTCTGGGAGCSAGFTAIFDRMDAIAGVLQPANVTIGYQYVGLGFAGGPIVPRVTVTLQNVPYNTITASILANLMSLATGGTDFPTLTTMPVITATFTGEDLSTAGAS